MQEMSDHAPIPVGRLQAVERDWEYQSGWVRAPLREIVFNDRLTKQARLVWLWLASVLPGKTQVSWGECETMLRCGTKARRNCIAQLIEEGFISVSDNGIVVMHDPYEVFNNKRKQLLQEIREEWQEDAIFIDQMYDSRNIKSVLLSEKKIDQQIIEIKSEEKIPREPKQEKKTAKEDPILNSWNECKPESYSSMRTVSSKQKECVTRHMKNIGLAKDEVEDFICTVCDGLARSEFWTSTVDPSGRNFNAVFGYGIPQDTKMKNIENLYTAGLGDAPMLRPKIEKKYTAEQQEVIDAYKFICMNLNSAKARDESSEVARWSKHLEEAEEQFVALNLIAEDL